MVTNWNNDLEVRIWARENLAKNPIPPIGSRAVEEMKAAIAEANRRIDELTKKVIQEKAIISPFRLLPVDVLARILALHFNSIPIKPLSSRSADRLAPLLVCKQWRRAAIENPFCWNRLHIILPLHNQPTICLSRPDALVKILSPLQMYFSRSRTAPIDFVVSMRQKLGGDLDYQNVHPSVHPANYPRVIHLLTESASRFRSFAESIGMANDLLPRLNNQLLTHLRFRNVKLNGRFEFPFLRTLYIDGMPTLDTLSRFNCVNLLALLLSGNFGLGVADGNNEGNFFGSIQGFPSLKHLTAGFDIIFMRDGPPHNEVKEIRLHGERLSNDIGGRNAHHAFQRFLKCLPRVISVTSDSTWFPERSPDEPFANVFDRIQTYRLEAGSSSTGEKFQDPFVKITTLQIGTVPPASVFEWDEQARYREGFFLLMNVLNKRNAEGIPLKWPLLAHIIICGPIGLHPQEVELLLGALQLRSLTRIQKKPDIADRCLLSLRDCFMSGHSERKIPNVDKISWSEACRMFSKM